MAKGFGGWRRVLVDSEGFWWTANVLGKQQRVLVDGEESGLTANELQRDIYIFVRVAPALSVPPVAIELSPTVFF